MKTSSFMKLDGFDNAYHLKGGILKYLEETPSNESLWQGECFVFDDRVSVQHNLSEGTYDMPLQERQLQKTIKNQKNMFVGFLFELF